jgi:methyl-accepting chemotaxis protein
MRHLTTRLVILLMLALMIITGAYDYTRLVRERSRFVEQTREDQRIFAETLALAVRQNLRRGRTTEELEEFLNEIVTRPGFIAVTIFGPAGKVVAQNVASGAASPTIDKTVRETLAIEEAVSALVTTDSGQMLRYVQPFRWPGGQAGAIEVQQTLEEVDRKFRHEIRERVVSRLGLLVAFVLSIVALTRWSIARPIRAVIQGARAVGRGDLTQQVQLGRRDEIGQLADEFNRMASNLQAARQEIFRQAEERLRLEQEVQQAQRLAAAACWRPRSPTRSARR